VRPSTVKVVVTIMGKVVASLMAGWQGKN